MVGGRDRHKAQREKNSEQQISDRGSQAWREKRQKTRKLGEREHRNPADGTPWSLRSTNTNGRQGNPEGRLGEGQGQTGSQRRGWSGQLAGRRPGLAGASPVCPPGRHGPRQFPGGAGLRLLLMCGICGGLHAPPCLLVLSLLRPPRQHPRASVPKGGSAGQLIQHRGQ